MKFSCLALLLTVNTKTIPQVLDKSIPAVF
nr:MAG TPA: hypothetical protein [Caudoviricetes sp.]